MTNLNLERLRETSGVFISKSDFNVIELEYADELETNNLQDTEEAAEQFYKKWKQEQEMFGTFAKTTDGLLYFCPEGADNEHPISTIEFIKNLDAAACHWEDMCRENWQALKEILGTEEDRL